MGDKNMNMAESGLATDVLSLADPDKPVLIAGPTASGKTALAIEIAKAQGGVIVNADASQVYDCWRILTARPSKEEEEMVPHHLFGHISENQSYSTGHWLREVQPLLAGCQRPIIVGGTGLYFSALTEGLANIPQTPVDVRTKADALSLEQMLEDLDASTRDGIDQANRARVQRAWEVLSATGRGLAEWQKETPAPVLPLSGAQAFVLESDKDRLNARIERRFDQMLDIGVLEEVRAVVPLYDPSLPAHRAIGAPELMAHLKGDTTLEAAREAVIIATRQFAKRQRTWFRSRMRTWTQINAGG